MFTGLVQAMGEVAAWDGTTLGMRHEFADVELGESIAVNGCCLTVVRLGEMMDFELSPETVTRTSFGDLSVGSKVNLERSLRVGDRLGGHIVQGHVDAVGSCVEIDPSAEFTRMRFRVPSEGGRYLIDKGSIAIDGISLTVVSPVGDEFDVWLIPETLKRTTLGGFEVGRKVNIEYDVLAKHVEKLLISRG